MMDNILQYTDKNMQHVIDNFLHPLDDSTKCSHVKPVDRVDNEVFIVNLYLRAGFRLNILDRYVNCNHESAHDIIGATMPLHSFKFICHLITFEQKQTQNTKRSLED